MNILPIDPHLVPLITSVKPYLGPKAKDYADMFTGVMKLLTSNSGQEVITTLSRMIAPSSDKTVAAGVTQGIGAQMFGANIAFSLFLILVLLIFATGGLGFPGLSVEEANMSDACGIPDGATEV